MLGTCGMAAARVAAVSVVVGVLLALGSASAYAGDWMQVVCQNPPAPGKLVGTPAPIQGFVASSVDLGSATGAYQTCSAGGLLVAQLDSDPGAQPAAGAMASWIYTAPAGSVIAGGTVSSYVNADSADGGFSWVSTPNDSPAGAVDECGYGPSFGCNAYAESFALPDSGGSQLFVSAECEGVGGGPCNTNNIPPLQLLGMVGLRWADILLSTDSQPTGSGFAGSLMSADAHGTANVIFTASDPNGPGVYRVNVKIDGSTVYQGTPNTNGGACVPIGTDPASGAWMFDYQQPCPASETVDVPVNTTTLADGEHQLQITVEDAAQDSSTVFDQTITTANFTSVAGTTSEGLAAVTSTPSVAPAPYAFKLDPATAALSASVLHSRYTASGMTLSGQVLQAGAPAPDVTVTAQAGSVSGTGYTTVAQTTTNAAGQFTLTVPRGDSRDLKITAGAQDVTFQQLVTPDVTLSARPLSGARILFTGNVAIDTAGSPVPLVELETWDPASALTWPVLTTMTVGKNGSFRYVYRAPALLAGYRFKFRALTPAVSGYWQGAVSTIKEAKVTL
jgi:hypothetical protein